LELGGGGTNGWSSEEINEEISLEFTVLPMGYALEVT